MADDLFSGIKIDLNSSATDNLFRGVAAYAVPQADMIFRGMLVSVAPSDGDTFVGMRVTDSVPPVGLFGGMQTKGAYGGGAGKWAERTMVVGGLTRTFLTYRPQGLSATGVNDAVFLFHGGQGEAARIAAQTLMAYTADSYGFVLVVPSSEGATWNDGRSSTSGGPDDVAFVLALKALLVSEGLLASARCFAAGMSNGGMMTIRLAVDAPSAFLAFCAVVANLPSDYVTQATASAKVKIYFIHGTLDPLMPFDGGVIPGGAGDSVLSSALTAARFRLKLTSPTLVQTDFDNVSGDGTAIQRRVWTDSGDGTVVQYDIVANGTHRWPGVKYDGPLPGITTFELSNADIMAFFGLSAFTSFLTTDDLQILTTDAGESITAG